jgi:hypothetical protein
VFAIGGGGPPNFLNPEYRTLLMLLVEKQIDGSIPSVKDLAAKMQLAVETYNYNELLDSPLTTDNIFDSDRNLTPQIEFLIKIAQLSLYPSSEIQNQLGISFDVVDIGLLVNDMARLKASGADWSWAGISQSSPDVGVRDEQDLLLFFGIMAQQKVPAIGRPSRTRGLCKSWLRGNASKKKVWPRGSFT